MFCLHLGRSQIIYNDNRLKLYQHLLVCLPFSRKTFPIKSFKINENKVITFEVQQITDQVSILEVDRKYQYYWSSDSIYKMFKWN